MTMEIKTCGFSGHRPNKLQDCYRFSHPMSKRISSELKPILEKLILEEGFNKFISGGAIGFDQIAFWTVHELKKKYPHIINALSIPFFNQPAKWRFSPETIAYYGKMKEIADEIVYVDELEGYQIEDSVIGEYDIDKMDQRNHHMVDNSDLMIALWDGTSGGTKNCVDYIREVHRKMYWINPNKEFELIIEENNEKIKENEEKLGE